jgi:Xaa-Pro dipeptidase
MAEYSLQPHFCRERRDRLAQILTQLELDAAVLIRPEHIHYFTGYRPASVFTAALVVTSDGHSTLAAPAGSETEDAASTVLQFDAQWKCTLRQDQLNAAFLILQETLAEFRALGVEGATALELLLPQTSSLQANPHRSLTNIDEHLWKLRRRKDPDEICMIRKAIEISDAMYARAREVITPGISELEVFSELQVAAVMTAGEPLTSLGNDFQCNSPGGPPRRRLCKAGELYILDLSPGYRGYLADICRTFSVDGTLTAQQKQCWHTIVEVLEQVEQVVRPGSSAREFYQHSQDILNSCLPNGCFHHLGHGFGLSPHEAPHLSDCWNDLFQVGDTFTVEPGLYAPELAAGMRLEQNYLVTDDGVERLTHFPLDMA